MGMIPESTIEEIKARTDIVELISSYGVQIKRSGSDYVACCPFHHEKTPSFHISPNKGLYHCFGCGESGTAINFVMKQEGLEFIEAAKKLAAQCNITIEEREDPDAGKRKRQLALHAQIAEFFTRCLRQAKEAEPARRYFISRKLPDDIIDKFQIGYAPLSAKAILTWAAKYGFDENDLCDAGILLPPRYAGGSFYNRFGGRLMFSIRDKSGRVIAFSGRVLTSEKTKAKYVNSPETLIFKKSNVLYALDRAAGPISKAKNREALVCEGQIDVIRCHASGFETAVASEGTSFTPEHAAILKRCADSVALVFDGDGAGQKATIRTAGIFLAQGMPVRVVTLPAGDDPDSFLRDKGPVAFQQHIDNAESITQFQVRVMRAKEQHPNSIDAVSRISKAVLETISLCTGAVVKETLLTQAALALGVPVVALRDDLARVKASVRQPKKVDETALEDEVEPELDEKIAEGREAKVEPPNDAELSFMEFLFSHDGDADVLSLMKVLPESLFSHPITKAFVRGWIVAGEGGEPLVKVRDSLDDAGREIFDRIIMSPDRTGSSELKSVEILHDFIRVLALAQLRRERDGLDSSSTPENDAKRLKLSAKIRILQSKPWPFLDLLEEFQ